MAASNISDESYDLARSILAVIGAVVLIAGLAGNTLSFIVWSKDKRTTLFTRSMFMALSLADNAVLIFPHTRYITALVFDYDFRKYSHFACVAHLFATFYALDVPVYILCALSLERLIAVKWPHKLRKIFNRKAKIITIFVVFFATLGKPFVKAYCKVTHMNLNGTLGPTGRCKSIYPCQTYVMLFHYCNLLILPSIFMLICNILIIHVLIKQVRLSKDLSANQAVTNSHEKGKNVTKMLITLVFVSFFFQTPAKTNLLIKNFFPEIQLMGDKLYDTVYYSCQIFNVMNSTINFFCYYFVFRKFRLICNTLLCGRSGASFEMSSSQNTNVGA